MRERASADQKIPGQRGETVRGKKKKNPMARTRSTTIKGRVLKKGRKSNQ